MKPVWHILSDSYTCGGNTKVGDRTIRCHKTTGHGTQTFTETVMNRSVSVRKNKISPGEEFVEKSEIVSCIFKFSYYTVYSQKMKEGT